MTQRTLDRLAFIARAKQLGCTLEEITGLTTAWDGGQCGPIQDQLRQLVAGKIARCPDPDRRPDDLRQRTADGSDGARTAPTRTEPATETAAASANPDAADVAATIQAVSLSSKPQPAGQPDIACTLSAGSMKGRIADWQNLLAHVVRREPIDGGVRSVFAARRPDRRVDAAGRRRAGLLPVLPVRDHRRHPWRRPRSARTRRCIADRHVDVRGPVMSAKKRERGDRRSRCRGVRGLLRCTEPGTLRTSPTRAGFAPNELAWQRAATPRYEIDDLSVAAIAASARLGTPRRSESGSAAIGILADGGKTGLSSSERVQTGLQSDSCFDLIPGWVPRAARAANTATTDARAGVDDCEQRCAHEHDARP